MPSSNLKEVQQRGIDGQELPSVNPVPEADDSEDDTLEDVDDTDDADDAELSDGSTDTLKKVPIAHTPKDDSQTNESTAEELARFRAEWRADLHSRLSRAEVPQPGPPHPREAPESSRPVMHGVEADRRPAKPAFILAPIINNVGTPRGPGFTEPLLPQQIRSLDLYRRAVTHEQRGELDEALTLYRQAFKTHEDVARLYDRQEFHSFRTVPVDRSSVRGQREGHDVPGEPDLLRLTQDLDRLHVTSDSAIGVAVTLPANHGVVTGILASVMSPWGLLTLTFEPEDERQPLHLRNLPDELLVHILTFLDVVALECFALVDRKARVLALDSTLWRRFVLRIYRPPQISEDEELSELVMKYKGDLRRVYVEHPRVRLDGVYIAVCHYTRAGLSENAWVNVTHLITYHRYLRFYPDGEVLSLLANGDVAPQQVIPALKPSLRMKGFFIGRWKLEGTTVYITDLMDPSGNTDRYTFQMILELRSRPLGRWNRLDFVTYDSVSVSTGEATPLALKNDRSFWFSKVRSYGA